MKNSIMHIEFEWVNRKRKRPLGRLGRSWMDNIKMDVRQIGWSYMTGFIWLGIMAIARFSYEHGNEQGCDEY
jgi:hypothetical protein